MLFTTVERNDSVRRKLVKQIFVTSKQ